MNAPQLDDHPDNTPPRHQALEDEAISAPRLTAEVLLTHALHRERSYLYAHPEEELTEVAWIHYGRYLHERMQGKPTQYITGHQEFYGRDFRVTSDVLIPRPETEHLVEAAIARIHPRDLVVDVGTGSGAIAVTLALETTAHVFATTDLSTAALNIAHANAEQLSANVEFVACDLLDAFRDQTANVLVSNPPYVPQTDHPSLQREVRDYEPHVALFGGPSRSRDLRAADRGSKSRSPPTRLAAARARTIRWTQCAPC